MILVLYVLSLGPGPGPGPRMNRRKRFRELFRFHEDIQLQSSKIAIPRSQQLYGHAKF